MKKETISNRRLLLLIAGIAVVFLSTSSFRVVAQSQGTAAAKIASQNNATKPPLKMAGGLPVIPGTAWKIDWGIRGGNVQRFLFCNSGRWEVVSSQLLAGALTLMGTYKVEGNSVVTKDANGGKVTNYKMAWKGDVLELTGGSTTMKLYDPVETQCK